jgi:CheY-like chemotaxis protein
VGRSVEDDDTSAEASGIGEQGESILVVEDDGDLRAYITEILRGLGYRVRAVPDAAAALFVLQEAHRRVDLLLTDVVMPGRNGRELGREAQSLRPGLPVLYMTGYSRNAVVHHGRLDEGVEVLQKPIGQHALASRVRDILDRTKG